MRMELLLLSSSRTPAGYFTVSAGDQAFHPIGASRGFVPFAAVTLSWEDYRKRVSDAIGIELHSLDDLESATLCRLAAETIPAVARMPHARPAEIDRAAGQEGKSRYLGWSAGANLACPTIKTTNDMPIVDPGGLGARSASSPSAQSSLCRFSLPGHHGETRNDRLQEFARVNPSLPVLGLPEELAARVRSAGWTAGRTTRSGSRVKKLLNP